MRGRAGETEELDAVRALYAAAAGLRTFPEALSTLARMFDADGCVLTFETSHPGEMEYVRFASDGCSPSDVLVRATDAADLFVGLLPGEPATLAGHVAAADRPAGLTDILAVDLSINQDMLLAVRMWRLTNGRAQVFSQAAVQRLREIVPDIEMAGISFSRLAAAERERRVYRSAVDELGLGVVLVNMRGLVLAANEVGGQMLAARDGLMILKGRLCAPDTGISRDLMAAIRDCAEAQSNDREPVTRLLSLPREADKPGLAAMVASGPKPAGLATPLIRSAVVLLSDPHRKAARTPEGIALLFGLTVAEGALALRLAEGLDLSEAAMRLGVSRNTVRSQLRSIFQKINVRRQTDMVRLILNSTAHCTSFGHGEPVAVATGEPYVKR